MHTPPFAAFLLTVGLIIYLFRRDARESEGVTGALWLPLIWMLITCTRALSEWLNVFDFQLGAASLEEGSPLDACFYFSLIAAGVYVLNQRQVYLSEILKNNQWLMIFLFYCLVSIVWSDFPFVAFKRWIKVLGHPIMVLIVLTEPDPEEAIVSLLKRCAYVVVLVSVLFIKYYPEFGRTFDPWTGAPLDIGIAGDKTALGHDCLILGYFFVWHVLNVWQTERSIARRRELRLDFIFLAVIAWLLVRASSATSSVCLLVGLLAMWVVGMRAVNRRLIGTYIIVAAVSWLVLDGLFDIYGHAIQFLNKDPTLTDRTVLWGQLLSVKINPIFGAGFESFWLGDRLKMFWDKYWWHPNQAHNGYLETYLNLGLLGLALLIAVIAATFYKVRQELLTNLRWGRFRLGLLLAVVLYNWTEASFKANSAMWFAFYIIAMDYPRRPSLAAESSSETPESEEEREFAYLDHDGASDFGGNSFAI